MIQLQFCFFLFKLVVVYAQEDGKVYFAVPDCDRHDHWDNRIKEVYIYIPL